MSLPPNFVDELRTRLSLAQVVGRKVIWDARKSNPGKGDMWAPCPFHQEKSASFHVDDRKGYYYCFGCHAKGDAISFVRETENVGFMEAVEVLAREAGMPMPARDPVAAQRADRRSELAAVMEQAVQYYRMQLNTSAAAGARAYLDGRKLDQAGRDRFEIGFAPESWQGLWDHLKGKGIADDLILGAGLAKPSTKGKAPYDVFRNRIMFPIRDARGRCIAFGGRAMDPNDGAKYLNSPETELFDKGRNLYNHGPSREAAGKGQPLIVAEGYMDVIALVQAGFTGAVAPLGTAVTEDQLRLMWRIHPEPVIALDGDAAGIRAALRVIDLALPLLEAGNGLRFALMPQGQDPDDVIRSGGRAAMEQIIDQAKPMIDLLWQREAKEINLDSPERMAALRRRFRELVNKIADKDIRNLYKYTLNHRLSQLLFVPNADWRSARGKRTSLPMARPETRASLLVTEPTGKVVEIIRGAAIVAVCLVHPKLLSIFLPALERLELVVTQHATMLRAIMEHHVGQDKGALQKIVNETVGAGTVESLLSSAYVSVLPAIKNFEDEDLAASTLAEQLAKLSTQQALRREIEDAEYDMGGLVDEGLTWRLMKAVEEHNRASALRLGDYEDAGEDRESLSKTLQNMIDSQVWVKNRG